MFNCVQETKKEKQPKSLLKSLETLLNKTCSNHFEQLHYTIKK